MRSVDQRSQQGSRAGSEYDYPRDRVAKLDPVGHCRLRIVGRGSQRTTPENWKMMRPEYRPHDSLVAGLLRLRGQVGLRLGPGCGVRLGCRDNLGVDYFDLDGFLCHYLHGFA